MFIVKYRKIWYSLSILFVLVSLFSIFYYGLNLSIDFKGGSVLEVEYKNDVPKTEEIQNVLSGIGFNVVLQPMGEKGLIVKSKDLTEGEHQNVLTLLTVQNKFPLEEKRFDSIGPVIGKELYQKSWIAISLVAIMIILYIAFVFRKVSVPVSSFYYGLFAVTALIHDVTIPIGVFALLGKFMGVEIDILFITALLTILGFSVHDTIVVYDRIRENIKRGVSKNFEEIVGLSINQTITRSINTSLTVFLVLLAMFFFGGETTKFFSLALIIGVFFGTYSSIFLASPFLATYHSFQNKGK